MDGGSSILLLLDAVISNFNVSLFILPPDAAATKSNVSSSLAMPKIVGTNHLACEKHLIIAQMVEI